MPDMLSKAQRWLSTVRKDRLSTDRQLTYIEKCSGERIDMTYSGVVIGNSAERLDQGINSSLDVEERDYIIPISAFRQRARAKPFRPVRGDMIEEIGEDGTSENKYRYTFRIVPHSGDVAWEWHDRERTAYRVHCHLVKAD